MKNEKHRVYLLERFGKKTYERIDFEGFRLSIVYGTLPTKYGFDIWTGPGLLHDFRKRESCLVSAYDAATENKTWGQVYKFYREFSFDELSARADFVRIKVQQSSFMWHRFNYMKPQVFLADLHDPFPGNLTNEECKILRIAADKARIDCGKELEAKDYNL